MLFVQVSVYKMREESNDLLNNNIHYV